MIDQAILKDFSGPEIARAIVTIDVGYGVGGYRSTVGPTTPDAAVAAGVYFAAALGQAPPIDGSEVRPGSVT